MKLPKAITSVKWGIILTIVIIATLGMCMMGIYASHQGATNIVVELSANFTIKSIAKFEGSSGCRFALVYNDGATDDQVIIDGVRGEENVGAILAPGFVFSSNGAHCAYAAHVWRNNTNNWGYCMFVDNDSGPMYEYIGNKPEKGVTIMFDPDDPWKGTIVSPDDRVFAPIVSRDGTRVAYRVHKKNEQMIVVNDVAHPAFTEIKHPPIFSFDGKHIAYIASGLITTESGVELLVDKVVLDGLPIYSSHWGPADLIFSPDGLHMAFRDVRLNTIVLDGKPLNEFESVEAPKFSPDSKHLMYAAEVKDRGRTCLVVDGEVLQEGSSKAKAGMATFSPDSLHTAYVGFFRNYFIVKDGVKGVEYDDIVGVKFSPNSQRLAYFAKAKNNWYCVVDDVVSPAGAMAGSDRVVAETLIFSDDSNHVAFALKKGEKWSYWKDQKQGPEFDDIFLGSARFSSNGGVLAYVAKRGKSSFVVVNEEVSQAYDKVFRLVVTPDGRHVAFAATTAHKTVVVIDNVAREIGALVAGPVLRDDGAMEFIAIDQSRKAYAIKRTVIQGMGPSNIQK